MTSEFREANKQVEIRELERRLAEECAASTVDSCCFPAGEGWYDTDMNDDVTASVRYLELRGLLERWPGAAHIVRVRKAA